MKTLVLLSTLIFSLLLFAEENHADDLVKYVMCKNQNIVRTIRVEREAEEKVCITTYTKNGEDKEVGRVQNSSSCTMFAENIRGNLEKAGWKCRDVSEAMDVHSAKSLD